MAKEGASKHEGGFELYTEKLRVRIRLPDYPMEVRKGEFDIGEFNILETYFKSRPSNFTPVYRQLFTHQLDLQDSGHAFTLLFQGPLVPYLKKEVKPGDYLLLYMVFGIHDVSRKRTILLVNEFSAEDGKAKKEFGRLDDLLPPRSLPQYLQASAISSCPPWRQLLPDSRRKSPQFSRGFSEVPWRSCIL